MKKANRKLIPALAMLLVSAIMLSTASFAWFTTTQTVKATGMKVQAEAPTGIVISYNDTATWGASATAGDLSANKLQPTSTSDGTYWLSAVADSAASHVKNAEGYSKVIAADGYYMDYLFKIKSATNAAIAVDSLTATVAVTKGTGQELDKPLRVGIKIGDEFKIIAPNGGETSYKVSNKTTDDTVAVTATSSAATFEGTKSIPAFTAAGTDVHVFVWYEGEDAACMTNNVVANLNEMAISVDFTYAATE